jgi:hypothetical protein
VSMASSIVDWPLSVPPRRAVPYIVASTTVYDDGRLSIAEVDPVTIEVRTSLRLADREPKFFVVFATCLVAAIAALSIRQGWGIASWSLVPVAVVPVVGAVWMFRRNRRGPTARVDRERWTVEGGPLIGLTQLGGPPVVTVRRSRYGGWAVALRGPRRSAAVTHPGRREYAEPVADRLAEVLGVTRA